MKILYGVQGTGNGHISRCYSMAEAFSGHPDVQIDWLFSGRSREQLQEVNLPFSWRRGMTFHTRCGRIDHLTTILRNNAFVFMRDFMQLDLAGYDLVISDFEPVVSWAAMRARRKCVGIGHQYAFNYAIPARKDLVGKAIMRSFAPVALPLGLHWHHFDQPILPPIITLNPDQTADCHSHKGKVLVYLPFEDMRFQQELLAPLTDYEFYIYGPQAKHEDLGHIHTRPTSRTRFKADLINAEAIICNTGFELISEAMTLGKRVLTRPLEMQVEQMSNALALEQLGYAQVVYQLNRREIKAWLHKDEPAVRISYPDVAKNLASWLVQGDQSDLEDFSARLWSEVSVENSRALLPSLQPGHSLKPAS